LALLATATLFWWFFGSWANGGTPLKDALIPHREMPFRERVSIFGWLSIFVGVLHALRALFLKAIDRI
jgi:hypothetical protein